MQNVEMERKIIAILRVLSNSAAPVGAVVVARELEAEGIHLDSRTVRYHLKIMDERGLTVKHGLEGRSIAPAGLRELHDSLVFDRVGYIISKIENLSYQVTFDPGTCEGKVIINTAIIPRKQFDDAREIISAALKSRIGLSRLSAIRKEGEMLGELVVPEGMVGFGTVCSILVNGVLIKQGIPVDARFGGVIAMEAGEPRRFTEVINYAACSTDPLELFTRGGFTSVLQASRTGTGKVLANYREIPAGALPHAENILEKLSVLGFTGMLGTSRPGQPLYGVATSANRCGIAVMGGLNAFAACHESGIDMSISAISTLVDFAELAPIEKLNKK
jgi:HTH-type transcriptional regulator, global nitrogen regulator NrpRI